ncbi:hypothetical protein V500_05134 [Pseudogymnoascus sp. VKM F-4518 (FW-2643)]|nr:hypothetical protein V500_05134 [Pseudogymnoascus sp. VKM F-4518 (FW-2643)]
MHRELPHRVPLQDHQDHQHVHCQYKKRTHAPHPADAHGHLPLRDDEDAHKPKRNAVRVERDAGLDGRAQEALHNVVAREQGVGEAVLGAPHAAAAARNPEGDGVVEEVPKGLSAEDADPGRHGEEGELERREAVAAGDDGGHEVDSEGGGLHDGQAEGNEDEGSDREGDGGDCDLEGDNGAAFLGTRIFRWAGLGHWGAPWDAGVAAEGGVLDEEEDQENGCTNGPQGPPEDVFPRLGLGDKPTQSAATDDGKDDQHLEDGKGLAALVQKEHVHDESCPHDSGDDAEQATDEARDGEWDEVIWARHVRRPDLARKGADETPEDDRTATDEAGERREQERTSHPPSERGGDGVEQVGLRLSVRGDLEDKGELVGVGRHLAREAGEADACENDDLLPYRPVLC